MYILDEQLLNEFGVKTLSDDIQLVDQIIILYCFKKNLPIPKYYYINPENVLEEKYLECLRTRDVGEDIDHPTQADPLTDPSFIRKVKDALVYDTDDPILKELLPFSSFSGSVYYTYCDLYNALEYCDGSRFEEVYPRLLVGIIQASAEFRRNPQYSFGVASAIAKFLIDREVESVEEYSVNSCFLAALLPQGIKYLPYGAGGSLFRYLPVLRDAMNVPDLDWDDDPYRDTAVVCPDPDERFIERCIEGSLCYLIVPTTDVLKPELAFYAQETIETNSYDITTGKAERIVVLSFLIPNDDIIFEEFDGKEIKPSRLVKDPVPIEEIERNGYNLVPNFYTIPTLGKGEEYRRIGELCEIDQPCNFSGKCGYIPYYEFASDFRRILITSKHPKIEPYRNESESLTYKGPHIHLSRAHSFGLHSEVFVSNTSGVYHCPARSNFALRIKDNSINPYYLAYILSSDADFCLTYMIANPSEEVFLNRKIAVLKDRNAQDAFIDERRLAASEVVKSDARYCVVFVDNNSNPLLSDKEVSELDKWQIEMTARINSISQLKNFLFENKNGIDAVVMDASIESSGIFFKGLRTALSICNKYDIPLYSYSSAPKEQIEAALNEDEFGYLSNQRLFDREEGMMLRKLSLAMRGELDNKGIPSAIILDQYKTEFEAAKWIDSRNKESHIASDMRFILSQPNHSLNRLRGVFRSLLRLIVNGISKGSGLENVDLGAIPELINKGYCSDGKKTGRFYSIVGNVIPGALARSLVFANEILNAASHTEQVDDSDNKIDLVGYLNANGSEHLSTAVINIVMDLILWIWRSECKFDGYCTSHGLNERQSVDLTGPIVKVSPEEYYCDTENGKVHIFVGKNFKYIDGMVAHIFEVTEESSKMRNKYQKFSRDGWEIVKYRSQTFE